MPSEQRPPIQPLPTGSRICVIGGGSAGLITCKTLSVEGYDCVLYEKAPEVGGVWHYNRYPGVAIQSPIELYEIADFPFEAGVQKYATGAQIRRYFMRYATTFDIMKRIQFNREVISCAREVIGTREPGEMSAESTREAGESEEFEQAGEWIVTTKCTRTGAQP